MLGVVLPLALFGLLAVALALVLRRTGRVIADTRELEGFHRTVEDLALRVDVSLGGIVARIDAVRRHQLPPAGIADELAAALDAVERYQGEAAELAAPSAAAPLTAGILSELARAERALEMVDHGCRLMATSRGMGRDVEGETAVKRGYLNLLHAREAVADYAVEIRETKGGLEPRWYSRRGSA